MFKFFHLHQILKWTHFHLTESYYLVNKYHNYSVLINISLDECQSYFHSNQALISLCQNFKLVKLLTFFCSSFISSLFIISEVWVLMSQSVSSYKYKLRTNICLLFIFCCIIIEYWQILISSVSVCIRMKWRYYDNMRHLILSFSSDCSLELSTSSSVCSSSGLTSYS